MVRSVASGRLLEERSSEKAPFDLKRLPSAWPLLEERPPGTRRAARFCYSWFRVITVEPTRNAVRIGVIGDFEPAFHSHFATNAALYDAATRLGVPVELRWLPTPSLTGSDAEKILSSWHGLVASPGSPYR